MTKRDFVVRIANEVGLTQNQVQVVVQKFIDYVSNELSTGKTIELRNFGVFEVKVRKSRVGRNPNRPEKTVVIPERSVVKFRAGKELKDRVEQLKSAKSKAKAKAVKKAAPKKRR